LSIRRIGIAFGSLVAAWLCMALIGGWLFGWGGGGLIATVATLVLGALIYRDIVRRDDPSA
jgi:hypothetical protein